MRHLENAFKFTFKNFLLTLPLLISLAIPALISGVGSLGIVANSGAIAENFKRIIENSAYDGGIPNYGDLFAGLDLGTFIASSIISGLLSFVLMILVKPATFGFINLHYETGNAKLNDFTRCMSKYIGRFVLFGLLNIAFAIGLGVVLLILVIIGGVVSSASTGLGVLLIILFVLAFFVGVVVLFNYLNLWFPAVCVEDSDIIQGLKNSFRTVRGSFWPILGITLLVTFGAGVARLILGSVIGVIPVIGSIVAPIISGLAEFILMVYYFEVYREKTGRYTLPEPPPQFGGFQDGGVQ